MGYMHCLRLIAQRRILKHLRTGTIGRVLPSSEQPDEPSDGREAVQLDVIPFLNGLNGRTDILLGSADASDDG